MSIALKVENLSKAYQLGSIGTGTISRDIERWFAKITGKEDPFLKIGETNNREIVGSSDIVWSLKDINFEVEQGEAIGIIGKNGAGKSTLLKILSKITAPTSGKITGTGRIASLLEIGTGFHPELTGRENIYLNGAILGMRKQEITRKFDEIVEFAGVSRYIETPVKRYSSGMYVRLAFAVAAHLESEILIVDEVLAVGDVEFQKKCLGKMGDISKGEGRTVLFVSHNMQSISRLCTKSLLLQNGMVNSFDNTRKILEIYNKIDEAKDEVTFDYGFVKYLKVQQVEDKIELVCQYQNWINLDIPVFGFVFSDIQGNKLFGSNNIIQEPNISFIKSERGIIRAIINQPKLLDGEYLISIWLGDGHEDFFVQENLLTIKITEMAQYKTSVSSDILGSISPTIDWIQEIC